MKDLSLHILDIIQNSIRAEAETATVDLSVGNDGLLTLMVSDNGKGMDPDQLSRVKDPFFTTRTTRGIGLGVSLLSQKAEQAGGALSIASSPGVGTTLKAVFNTKHPDCPPLGDIPGSAWMLMATNPKMRIVFSFKNPKGNWVWDSNQIREELGGLPLTEALVRTSIIAWFSLDFVNFKENCFEM